MSLVSESLGNQRRPLRGPRSISLRFRRDRPSRRMGRVRFRLGAIAKRPDAEWANPPRGTDVVNSRTRRDQLVTKPPVYVWGSGRIPSRRISKTAHRHAIDKACCCIMAVIKRMYARHPRIHANARRKSLQVPPGGSCDCDLCRAGRF